MSDNKMSERLRWLCDRMQEHNPVLWSAEAREYDGKHDRLNCSDADHAGCIKYALVETARRVLESTPLGLTMVDEARAFHSELGKQSSDLFGYGARAYTTIGLLLAEVDGLRSEMHRLREGMHALLRDE